MDKFLDILFFGMLCTLDLIIVAMLLTLCFIHWVLIPMSLLMGVIVWLLLKPVHLALLGLLED